MEHVRTIGALERESGSPGEAQAFDYIERTLTSYGVEVERREIEAYISLPQEGRLILPDGGEIEGLTHSFSTSVDALDAEVVDVGDGRPDDMRRAAGKIALVRGLASPGRAWAAQQAGTLGQIFVLMDHLHNMIVTTIWGTPSPETAWRIPTTPCLSVLGVDGERLRALLARGPLRLRMTTRVRTGWMPIPHLVAALAGRREDRFVLFSGHVDSWHYGAMDNGTANATMLEVARLLAGRRPVVLGGGRAVGLHVALGAAEAGHRAVARDGAAGGQRRVPVVVAHQGRHRRQDRRGRAGPGHEGVPGDGAALAQRAAAPARPRARRAEPDRGARGPAGRRRR